MVQLLVEGVSYDGREGKVVLHFRPTGIKALAAEAAAQQEAKA